MVLFLSFKNLTVFTVYVLYCYCIRFFVAASPRLLLLIMLICPDVVLAKIARM